MIQANELRIGNWTFMESKQKYFQVGNGNDIDNCEDLKPIELTEEILLKCGFERDNGVMCYTVDDFSDVKIVYETLANYYRLYPYTYNIKYLHNLQNIFYSITGQELEIRL